MSTARRHGTAPASASASRNGVAVIAASRSWSDGHQCYKQPRSPGRASPCRARRTDGARRSRRRGGRLPHRRRAVPHRHGRRPGDPRQHRLERRAFAQSSPRSTRSGSCSCNEPRGHADMYGGFLVPPDDDGAALRRAVLAQGRLLDRVRARHHRAGRLGRRHRPRRRGPRRRHRGRHRCPVRPGHGAGHLRRRAGPSGVVRQRRRPTSSPATVPVPDDPRRGAGRPQLRRRHLRLGRGRVAGPAA